MKKYVLAIIVAGSFVAGCTPNTGNSKAFMQSAEAAAKSMNGGAHHIDTKSVKAAEGVADPLHAVELTGNDITVEISNGYTKAAINGEFVKPTRINANYYEIKGAKYVVSISLNDNGVEDASWTARKGRAHGMLQTVEDSE